MQAESAENWMQRAGLVEGKCVHWLAVFTLYRSQTIDLTVLPGNSIISASCAYRYGLVYGNHWPFIVEAIIILHLAVVRKIRVVSLHSWCMRQTVIGNPI